ncbi:MAG: MFS transporter [Hyphomicrobiaceae bacterium]|nr:MFS transporter [Hyphomicrobiaceae bacterium]
MPKASAPTATWRTPVLLLILMAVANQISHQTWHTLVNNFAINAVSFTGREIGILQSVREIPGFLSFGVVFVLLFMREQSIALLALLALAVGTALTDFFPTTVGFLATTMLMSIGFHYYETTAQSLALQWLPKQSAARALGRIAASSSLAALAAYGLIYLTWSWLDLGFTGVYLIAGGITVALVVFMKLAFPYFPQEVAQRKQLVLRSRYWLYYALVFISGARRQIFIVFAGFMMVEKFGYSVTAITSLFLLNHVMNMIFAPIAGRLITRFGERAALTLEYAGLVGVFTAYAFVENATVAAVLYVVDHAFFAMAIALKTYFQKIADPADIAPTSGVAFTISHIAAVFLPFVLGIVWLTSPSAVFLLGASLAFCSLVLSRLVPRHPEPGREVLWRPALARSAT